MGVKQKQLNKIVVELSQLSHEQNRISDSVSLENWLIQQMHIEFY